VGFPKPVVISAAKKNTKKEEYEMGGTAETTRLDTQKTLVYWLHALGKNE